MGRKLPIYTIILLFLLLISPRRVFARDLYVAPTGNDTNAGTIDSPLASIDGARKLISSLGIAGNQAINVFFRGGTYLMTANVTFSSADSGTSAFPITYQGYANETPTFSGGKVLTGWTTTTVNGKAAWQTTINFAPSRQLFVNTVRATRARTPGNSVTGWSATAWTAPGADGGYLVDPSYPFTVAAPADVEVVHIANFLEYRCTVKNKLKQYVYLQQPCWDFAHQHAVNMPIDRINSSPNWLENAEEFLDQPGEFYANPRTKVIKYIPLQNQNINTPIVMPILENLITLNNVSNLTFKHLKFVYNTWIIDNNNGITAMIPDSDPAILMTGGDSVSFDTLSFQHLGGSGIKITSAKNTSVTNSDFSDISGRGITVGDSGAGGANPNIIIRNNTISKAGAEFHGDDAMVLGHDENISVDHNTLTDLPYSGMHITCAGGVCPNFIIGSNLIKSAMRTMIDGGGIYASGLQNKGLIIEKNVVTDNGSTNGAIYLDAGSMDKIVRNNVVFNNQCSYVVNGGRNTFANNYWQANSSNCFGDMAPPRQSLCLINGTSVACPPNIYTNNHVINALSGAPQAIVNDAGAHATAITPAITPTPTPSTRIPGDLTDYEDVPGDQVNIFDYSILKQDFGKTGAPGFIPSDITGQKGVPDGVVDIFDRNILMTNFGL